MEPRNLGPAYFGHPVVTLRPIFVDAAGRTLFTKRQQQTINGILRGMIAKETAAVLDIGLRTVETFVYQITKKTGTKSLHELVNHLFDSHTGALAVEWPTRDAAIAELDRRIKTLTPKEALVMPEIAKGLEARKIAKMFNSSPRTIEGEWAHAKEKLGVDTVLTMQIMMRLRNMDVAPPALRPLQP